MDTGEMRIVEFMRLRCQECAEVSDETARGWRTLLACDPDEPSEVMLATYCPSCAAREFGLRIDEQERDIVR